MLFYRAALPLSRATLTYLAGVVRRHRRTIGSCWRKLNCGPQALLVLVHLRNGETFAGLAAGFGIGTATAWRYVQETVALLAARAPKLDAALAAAGQAGHAFVVIDGTLIPIDRVAADRPFYSWTWPGSSPPETAMQATDPRHPGALRVREITGAHIRRNSAMHVTKVSHAQPAVLTTRPRSAAPHDATNGDHTHIPSRANAQGCSRRCHVLLAAQLGLARQPRQVSFCAR
jgi:hypothetical protein